MKLRKLIITLLAVVFAVSTVMALRLAAEYQTGNRSYEYARALAAGTQQETPSSPKTISREEQRSAYALEFRTPEPEHEETQPAETPAEPQETQPTEETFVMTDSNAAVLAEVDLEALRQVNSDVLGWIYVPGTDISYPIVQGANNDYYLEHTWDLQSNSVGAVFMEATNAGDLTDYRTILYAHNLRNGSMFSQLHNYQDQNFWAENPFVYVLIDAGILRYRIYAAYEAEVTGTTYWQQVQTEAQRLEYVRYGLEHSVLETGIQPTPDTPVLTLSTCTGYTYARRWVVQAVLEGMVIPPQ